MRLLSHSIAPALIVAAAAAAGLGIVAGLSYRKPSAPRPPATRGTAATPAAVDPAAPKHAGPRAPQVWVVAIGIDGYRDYAIPPCRGAVFAARTVGHWFVEKGGWRPQNVLMMDELGEAEPPTSPGQSTALVPTRANLNWAFGTWLKERVKPDDVVVVYYAGQTVTLTPAPDSPAGTPQRSYLLPVDARSLQWERSGWLLDEAIDAIASTGRNPVICWLDTSAAGRGERVIATGRRAPTPRGDQLLRDLARWPGVTAWLAADGKPATEAARVGELSPFTDALLNALGTAERPNNLNACLDRLNHEPLLLERGFRTLGGVDPGLDLWAARVRQASLSKRELLLQRGHAGAVSALAFTADGSRLISGAQDSTVKVWSASDRKLLRSLSYHMVGVTGLALNARGDRLASGDGAGWLRFWDMVQQEAAAAAPPHERGVDSVAFLPGVDLAATLDMDGQAWLWDAAAPAGPPRPLSTRCTGLAAASAAGPIAAVLAEDDGKLVLLGPDGKPLSTIDGPGGIVTSRRVATDGTRVVAGDDRGGLIVWDGRASTSLLHWTLPAAVDAVTVSATGWTAVASGRELRVLRPGDASPRARRAFRNHLLDLPENANRAAFSADSRWLAVGTTGGALRLWEMMASGTSRPVTLDQVETTGRTTTFAFSPDSARLVSGDQDGGLRTWELPDGQQRPPVRARRGQVACLSVSADGRYLLQITQDRAAQVWDLKDGRGLTTIDGAWTAGALAPDGATVYLTSEAEGDVVAFDRALLRRRATTFVRPPQSSQRFGKLSVSRDGRRIAAGSIEGPLACVWDAESGALAQTVRGHVDPHPIRTLELSADGAQLLTASEDGTARLWDLNRADPAPAATYTITDPGSGEPVPVTAAALAPSGPRRVVAGGIDGQLLLFEQDAKPLDLGRLGQSVLAIAFTPDGRWLAAAGADKQVWLWETSRPRSRLRLEPAPQHAEQVNALIAWPDSRLFASGSDDATIRLWDPAGRSLLGTLSAEQASGDWVAYTPDALFDCSIGGEAQVTWFDNRAILTLDQVYDRFHVFKLTDQLRQGIHPKAPAPPRNAPPRLTIETSGGPVATQRLARLTIGLSEPGLTNVRLYQNGVPVQAAEDLAGAGSERRLVTAPIPLRHGVNRFHVMAGRTGSTEVEGRSETVEIRYDGSDSPPQLHILALGVSRYNDAARSLQFADRDATQLAEFLHRTGLRASGTPGLQIVLTDDDVTTERVDDAFARLRDRVKGRPEDTVAVFLAGHADTLNERFYLLLPSFPFGKRDGAARARLDIPARSVLPYVALHRNLARLGALHRVVMIDACQAEAIRDDPGVRMLQELIDTEAHRARTAYLLAARRGEPAGEVAALAHGLMTYALLKGMGERNLESVPGLTVFDELPTADRNHDGVITTDELRWYTALTVPRLAASFPQVVMRQGATTQQASFRPSANLAQDPRVQASSASFPLIELNDDSGPKREELTPKSEK